MIAKLAGKISDILPDSVIVDVNGVGYKVEGVNWLKENDEAVLYIYTHVREQELRLFGFKSKDILIMFEKLLDVQGIGPKIAVKIVSLIDLEQIVMAIVTEDSSMLKVPGLGDKLAKKIIIDLKNKVGQAQATLPTKIKLSDEVNDVIQALLSLGFRRERIDEALTKISLDGKSQQVIIKEALVLLNTYSK